MKIKTSLAMAATAMMVAGATSAATVFYDYSGTAQFYYQIGSYNSLHTGIIDFRATGDTDNITNDLSGAYSYFTNSPLSLSITLGDVGVFNFSDVSISENVPKVGLKKFGSNAVSSFSFFDSVNDFADFNSNTFNILDISTNPVDVQFGGFDFENWTQLTPDSYYNVVTMTGAKFTTTVDGIAAIDAPPLSAVPEPASWATMIIGFGVIGSMLRLRRSRARVRVAN